MSTSFYEDVLRNEVKEEPADCGSFFVGQALVAKMKIALPPLFGEQGGIEAGANKKPSLPPEGEIFRFSAKKFGQVSLKNFCVFIRKVLNGEGEYISITR